MDYSALVTTLVIIGVIGIIIGVFLGVAGIVFKVETDEREELILKELPGNNCGGCGYPGCQGLASAIVKGEAAVNQCPVGGAAVGAKIAAIMGTEAGETVKKVAFVACHATCDDITVDYDYYGVKDCRMLSFVPNGGPKSCNQGCLGYGSCVSVCKFGAIRVENGVAVVDRDKCVACGKCVEVCPKHLITLIPYNAKYTVACNNTEKGPVTTKQCKVGCVGCGLCVRNCPNNAVKVENFNAVIDYDACKNCGVCAEKCPRKTIKEMY